MNARVKIDEDLRCGVAALFESRGYNGRTAADQGWSGASDETLWSRIQAEGRWLITADKGFADLRKYAPGTHSGIILLRSPQESRRSYLWLAQTMLQRINLDLHGALVVVAPRGIRVRRSL